MSIARLSLAFALLCATRSVAQVTGAAQLLPPMRVEAKSPNGTWPQAARDAMRDSIRDGQARWLARRPARYHLTAYKNCGFCPSLAWRPYGTYPLNTVVGDSVTTTVAIRERDTTQRGDWLLMSIDALFAQLYVEVNDPSRQIVHLQLDPYYGYPREWTADLASNGYSYGSWTDQDYHAIVLFFPPGTEPWPCGRWRRLIRRC